jgi:hypothetical protein
MPSSGVPWFNTKGRIHTRRSPANFGEVFHGSHETIMSLSVYGNKAIGFLDSSTSSPIISTIEWLNS